MMFLRALPIVFTAFTLGAVIPAHADATAGVNPFAELNAAGHEAYSAAKADILKSDQPVFLVTDSVTLIRGEELGSFPITPVIYDQLKSVSHISLGLYGAAKGLIDHPGSKEWLDRFVALRDAGLSAKENMTASVLNAEQQERQVALIDASIAYIDATVSAGGTDLAALTEYMQGVTPLFMANVDDSAIAQIDMIDKAVQELRTQLTDDEFARAIAVVTGPKMPRGDHLVSQYFAFAFNEDLETSKRIVYTENVFDPDGAMAILRTFVTERQLGDITFGNASRMERDLLADAATAELVRRFGEIGTRARP